MRKAKVTDGAGPSGPHEWSYPTAPPTAWPAAPAPPDRSTDGPRPESTDGPLPESLLRRWWPLGLALGALGLLILAGVGVTLQSSGASSEPSAATEPSPSPDGGGSTDPGRSPDPGPPDIGTSPDPEASPLPGAPGDAGSLSLEAPMDPRVVGGRVVVLDLDDVVGVDGEDLRPVWRVPCPGAAWASPISSRNEDIDIVTCVDQYVAFDARSGEVLWTQPIEGPTDRVRVGPTALLLQSDDRGVTVIDLLTGDHRFDVDISAPANVAADDAHLYRSSDLGMDAYDLSTGEEVWSIQTRASGLIATPEGVYARTNDHRVLRIDPATGETIQTSDTRRHDALAWSDFVDGDEDVVVLRATQGDSTVSVYDATTLDLLWAQPGEGQTLVGVTPGLVAISDIGRNDVTVYDARSGEPLDRVTGIIALQPAIDGERLYLVELDDSDGSTALHVHQVG